MCSKVWTLSSESVCLMKQCKSVLVRMLSQLDRSQRKTFRSLDSQNHWVVEEKGLPRGDVHGMSIY